MNTKQSNSAVELYKVSLWMLPADAPSGLDGATKVYIDLYTAEMQLDGTEDADKLKDRADRLMDEQYSRKFMDHYGWSLNMDWGIENVEIANEKQIAAEHFEIVESPQEKADKIARQESVERQVRIVEIKKRQIDEFRENLIELEIKKSDVELNEKTGTLEIGNKLAGDIKLPLDQVYKIIEMNTPDFNLTNSFGEKFFEVTNGSFLNVALADIKIYAPGVDPNEESLFNPLYKGGIFIRKDGTLQIGDMQRTRMIQINLSALARQWYSRMLSAEGTQDKATEIDMLKVLNIDSALEEQLKLPAPMKNVNREKVTAAIKNADAKLVAEINYHLNDVNHEDDNYDIVDAFEDAANLIEDSPIKELLKPLYRLYIEIGYAVECDITKVTVTSGKRYWFKMDGKHYNPISSWEQWINT